MIELLMSESLEFEIDPNEHGYPYLIITHKSYTGRVKSHIMLDEQGTKKLITELQRRLPEIKE